MIQRMARRCEDRFITTSQQYGRSTPRSDRGVDGDEIPGDRIESGHGQSSPVLAQEERATPGSDQVHDLWIAAMLEASG
jgi:hypothetical protein